jgi:hypothetical protein
MAAKSDGTQLGTSSVTAASGKCNRLPSALVQRTEQIVATALRSTLRGNAHVRRAQLLTSMNSGANVCASSCEVTVKRGPAK